MNENPNPQKDTEALILQAAEKEFLEKGYSGAKTTSIAEAAGVTHAMFHYYFRTIDELIGTVRHLLFHTHAKKRDAIKCKKERRLNRLSFCDPGEIYPKRGQLYCLSML